MHIELKQPSETELADMEDFARVMDLARLQGRLEAFAMAMTECSKPTRHEDGSMGGRDCREIHTAIDILHLDTLRQMKTANVELRGAEPASSAERPSQAPGSAAADNEAP